MAILTELKENSKKTIRQFFIEYRQYGIQLNSNCSYRCLKCNWWTHDDININITDPTYLKKIPKDRIINLFGGDPLINTMFNQIVVELIEQAYQIRIWSTGIGNSDRWLKLLPFLNRLYVYVPSGDPVQYQSIVGTYTWKQLEEQLDTFSTICKHIWINYEVQSETIQYLPELYEFAYYRQLPLLIHCNRSQLVDRESVLYLKRFYKVPNVYVFFTRNRGIKTKCLGVPNEVLYDRWQWFKNRLYNWRII